jgi:two-component system, NtrC family, response regulator AtoC
VRTVGALATHFVSSLGATHGGSITVDALALLEAQLAPGDALSVPDVLRELSRAGAPVLAPVAAAPSSPGSPATGSLSPGDESLEGRREDAERLAVKEALDRANGSRALAARLLGVSRRTLYNKLDEYGMG